jgi:hypothetical protein
MHTASRKTSWVKPAGYIKQQQNSSSGEWLELRDPKSDRVYYMNAVTRKTSWVKPTADSNSVRGTLKEKSPGVWS